MSYRPFHVHVHRSERLSPHFLRITLTGDELRHFRASGPFLDQRLKLIFPTDSGDLPVLDAAGDWFAQWSALPAERRGPMRSYSVRQLLDAAGHRFLVIDFVLHLAPDATGPAARWARDARPGDPLLVIGPSRDTPEGMGVEFLPGTATRIVLVGDETAAPAIARILDDLPADARGQALIEVPTQDDVLSFPTPERMTVRWLPRHGLPPGQLLLDHFQLTGREPSPGEVLPWETPDYSSSGEPLDVDKRPGDGTYHWIAGEAVMVTTLRRHLVRDRGVARSQVSFMGYWKQGVAMRG
ncbi:siderophore-interacting protein [Corynebacterium nasicanis]|uniref:Siderophore-interacting protein n=1 Tax=Corynebacterium nasicanis TaxID=1448267 RepID=A0ABW1QG80_9CORY